MIVLDDKFTISLYGDIDVLYIFFVLYCFFETRSEIFMFL